MYRSVLVPLDGSTHGEHALPLGICVAQRAGTPLHLVLVHAPLAPMYAQSAAGLESTLDPRIRDQERVYLDTVTKRIVSASQVRVTSTLLEGQVADAIREHVQRASVDLIVMTTHGRGPISRFWLGSVADQLIRRLSTPLLLTHPSGTKADFAARPLLRRMLIPLDGSESAEQILEPAAALGLLMDVDCTLLRIVEPLMSIGYDPVTFAVNVLDERSLTLQQEEAQAYLDRIAERLRKQSLRVHTRVLTCPQPATAILDEAAAQTASLIALQTHGRRGLARVVLGSVADKVVRGSTLPVLVYRPNNKPAGKM